MGPTASGKTALAEALAETTGAQLVNADAFQVYRDLDIGTAKPEQRAKYELLDLKEPDQDYGLGEYLSDAHQVLTRVWAEQRSAIVVGGTGLYVRALFEEYAELGPKPDANLRSEIEELQNAQGLEAVLAELAKLDPKAAEAVDRLNPQRVRRALERARLGPRRLALKLPPFRRLKCALSLPVQELDARIESRVHTMMAQGWIDEVRSLLARGIHVAAPSMRAIGYLEIARYLQGEAPLEGLASEIVRRTRRYAKRQRTWLRSEQYLIDLPHSMDDALTMARQLILTGEGRIGDG